MACEHQPRTGAQAGSPITVLTYNVHSCVGLDGRFDLHRTAEVIASCDPDVVALQELDVGRQRTGFVDQSVALAEHLKMASHFHPAMAVESEKYGDAVLSRLPMKLIKADALPGYRRREPRGAIWVSVDVGGQSLQIFNTHLGLSPVERSAQVRHLLGEDWLGSPACCDPFLLVGDLNAGARSRVYRKITSRMRDSQRENGNRPRPTFPARLPLLRIDHIFCSKSVEVMDVFTPKSAHARVASDHLPLVAELRVASAASKVSRNDLRRHGLRTSEAPSGSPR